MSTSDPSESHACAIFNGLMSHALWSGRKISKMVDIRMTDTLFRAAVCVSYVNLADWSGPSRSIEGTQSKQPPSPERLDKMLRRTFSTN